MFLIKHITPSMYEENSVNILQYLILIYMMYDY
jgi:hypothetical protein